MFPTSAQLITIVILLVPGFISIQVYSKLIPTRRLATFDATVLSIIFSLLIHGTFSTLFTYLNIQCVNSLLEMITNKHWSLEMSRLITFYLLGLIIYSIFIGFALALLNDKDRLSRLIKWLGFNYSIHENLWDEVTSLYSMQGKTPVVILHFSDISYAGWVYRASIDLEKNERKEIVLAAPRRKKSGDENWVRMDVNLVYLNLADITAIEYINGDVVLNSKY